MIKYDVIFQMKMIKIKLVHCLEYLNQKLKINIEIFHLKPPFAFHAPISLFQAAFIHPLGLIRQVMPEILLLKPLEILL